MFTQDLSVMRYLMTLKSCILAGLKYDYKISNTIILLLIITPDVVKCQSFSFLYQKSADVRDERDTCDEYRDRKHHKIPDISRRYQLFHQIGR